MENKHLNKLMCNSFSDSRRYSSTIEHLEMSNDKYEKQLKSSDIIIRGIPLLENENGKLLKNLFTKISKAIGFDSSTCIIINIFRIISLQNNQILTTIPVRNKSNSNNCLSSAVVNSATTTTTINSTTPPTITATMTTASTTTLSALSSSSLLSSTSASSSSSSSASSSSTSCTTNTTTATITLISPTIINGTKELIIPIIVKFAIKEQQLNFLQKFYNHKTLYLIEIGFNLATRIYISQTLSHENILLFRHAFNYKNKGLLHSVHIYKDAIYVRQSLSTDAIRIEDINQIDNLVMKK